MWVLGWGAQEALWAGRYLGLRAPGITLAIPPRLCGAQPPPEHVGAPVGDRGDSKCLTAGPDGTQETIVRLGSPIDPRVQCDTEEPHGTQGTRERLWNLMEPWLHYDTTGPNAAQETTVRLRNLMEKSLKMTQRGLTEPRIP